MMKSCSSRLFSLALTGAAGLAFVPMAQAASVLTGIDPTIPTNHGSGLAGTALINLLWSVNGNGTWDGYGGWTSNGGDVYQLDGRGEYGDDTFNIAFTPANGSTAVLLTSLTLNDWGGGGGNTVLNWSVTGSVSGVLGSGTGVSVADGTAQALNLGYQGVGGETLTLALTPTAGAPSYFAVDNISFDQVAVPEPSAALLAAGGLGALALRRRRK